MNKQFTKKLTHNWIIKLICLTAAVLLWLYYHNQHSPPKKISIPIKLKNIPTTLAIAESFRDTVTIKVKGPENVIEGISAKYLSAEIDMKNAVIGKNSFPINVKWVKKIKKVKIASTDPNRINIKIDTLISKEVPISITVINSPVEGYKKTGESFFPKNVIISGAESVIEKLDVVRTKPIDIGGLEGNIQKNVELDLPVELEFLSIHKKKKISVTIKIRKNYKTKEYKNVKITFRNLQDGLKIENLEDMHAYVKIEGPPERLKILRKKKNFLFINLSGIKKEDTYYRKVRYKIPRNCKMIKIVPADIKVNIEEK